jgi:hypothetical protein
MMRSNYRERLFHRILKANESFTSYSISIGNGLAAFEIRLVIYRSIVLKLSMELEILHAESATAIRIDFHFHLVSYKNCNFLGDYHTDHVIKDRKIHAD